MILSCAAKSTPKQTGNGGASSKAGGCTLTASTQRKQPPDGTNLFATGATSAVRRARTVSHDRPQVRTAAKIDGNQTELVAALEAALGPGCVLSLAALGKGVPDLLVAWGGTTLLVEVKQPGCKLTPDQDRFHRRWPGRIVTAESAAVVLQSLGVRV